MIYNVGSGASTANKVNYNNTQSGLSADNVQGAIDEIDGNLTASDNLKFKFATDGEGNYGYLGADDSFIPFSTKPVMLWSNPNPTTSMAQNTKIALDLTEYNFVIIETKTTTTSDILPRSRGIFPVRTGQKALIVGATTAYGTGSANRYARQIFSIENDGVLFGYGFNGTSSNNAQAIPMTIWGVKDDEHVVPKNPFNLNRVKVYDGVSTLGVTVDIKTILPDIYTQLREENFALVPIAKTNSYTSSAGNKDDTWHPVAISYNPMDGILTVPATASGSPRVTGIKCDVYCYY